MDETLKNCKTDWTNSRKCVGTNERDERVNTLENHGHWTENARDGDDNVIIRIRLDNEEINGPWEHTTTTRGDGSEGAMRASGASFRTYGGNDKVTLCVADGLSDENAWAEGFRQGTHDSFIINGHMAVFTGDKTANPVGAEHDLLTIRYYGDRLNSALYDIDDNGMRTLYGENEGVSYAPQSRSFTATPEGIPLLNITSPDQVRIEKLSSEAEFLQCVGAYSPEMLLSEVDEHSAPAHSPTHTPAVAAKTVQKG